MPSNDLRRTDRPATGPRSSTLLACLSAGLLAAVLPGCVTPIDGGRGFAPFYESTAPAPAVVERHGAEVARASAPGSATHLWPLFSHVESEERSETRILYPLIKDERTARERRSWVLPIFHRSRYTHEDTGDSDVQTLLLPFFWGHDEEDGGYFSIFPLGGTAKNILTHDRIDYALFPLYARARDRDRVSHHVLFPIFNYTSGTRMSGGRVFPLFSRYSGWTPEGKPRYRRSSYLWPLIHIHDNDLDTDSPTKVRWFFPLYGRIDSDRLQRWSILWPFLGKDVFPRKEWTSTYLFPLLRFGWQGDELAQYDFYPIYGHKNYRGNQRSFLFWPFIGWERQDRKAPDGDTHLERRSRWFFPFYRHTHQTAWRPAQGEGEARVVESSRAMTRVWPVYRYRQHEDGRQEWNLLDPLPFVDPPGFDAFYSRIWRIYREVDDPVEQRRAWELLWGIAGGSRTPERKGWSILGGLFGVETERGDDGTSTETTWRVLYIPF